MKHILSFFIIFIATISQVNADDLLVKQNNEKILNSLSAINAQYSSGNSPALSNECKIKIRNILLEYDDPYEIAILMVLSNYMVRDLNHENRISSIFNALTEYYGMQRLKKLKSHPNFTKALQFLQRSIRIDAGLSYMFSEVIWDARNVDGIKKTFKEEIKKWANGIKKHGSKSDREILKEYEKKEPELVQ